MLPTLATEEPSHNEVLSNVLPTLDLDGKGRGTGKRQRDREKGGRLKRQANLSTQYSI